MPRGTNGSKPFHERVTTESATTSSFWALMAGGTPEQMCDWDIHQEHLAGVVAECLQTGAAITFGAKRDLSGMSLRVYHEGAIVLQRYCDNVFDLNEFLGEMWQKLRDARLAKQAKP